MPKITKKRSYPFTKVAVKVWCRPKVNGDNKYAPFTVMGTTHNSSQEDLISRIACRCCNPDLQDSNAQIAPQKMQTWASMAGVYEHFKRTDDVSHKAANEQNLRYKRKRVIPPEEYTVPWLAEPTKINCKVKSGAWLIKPADKQTPKNEEYPLICQRWFCKICYPGLAALLIEFIRIQAMLFVILYMKRVVRPTQKLLKE
jgi:hypothetical protein